MDTVLLQLLRDSDLRLYAIWSPPIQRLGGPPWLRTPPRLLTDARALQYWDGRQDVGRWYSENTLRSFLDLREVAWNTYALYEPDAQWPEGGLPREASRGRTTLGQRRRLIEQVTDAVDRRSTPPPPAMLMTMRFPQLSTSGC